VQDRPPRPARAETREIVELKQLKQLQPELASAIDMQLALVEMQRRVQGRVPLPRIAIDQEWARAQQAAGRPLVRFADIPLEWSDFRLTLRQTADILMRFEALDRTDFDRIVALGRDGNVLEPLVSSWYNASSGVEAGVDPRTRETADAPAGLDQVLVLALRPFLARCAEALTPQVDLASWNYGHCPICGWATDFAVITPRSVRRLF
jgi:hypothetical protein